MQDKKKSRKRPAPNEKLLAFSVKSHTLDIGRQCSRLSDEGAQPVPVLKKEAFT